MAVVRTTAAGYTRCRRAGRRAEAGVDWEPMLRVYHSHRLERLGELLAGQLRESLASPLQPLWVGVQNPGLGLWLQRYLAGREGAVVNLECLDARRWCRRLCAVLLGQREPLLPWEPDYLAWWVAAGFQADAASGPWLGLRPTARHRLARQLAACYADYHWRRPHWPVDWQAGTSDQWQARLWQSLGEAVTLEPLLQRLREAPVPPALQSFWLGLGDPPLPPGLLRTLATRLDLHLMVCLPGSEPLAAPPGSGAHPLRDAGMAVEQALRERLGGLGGAAQVHPAGVAADDSLLGLSQADIVADRPRADPRPRLLATRDRSVQVHICHSPMREVEVLFDQLLALLQADAGLTPADVLVLMPASGNYGPLVEAVFGAAEGDRYIPFSVQEPATPGGLSGAFLALLRLPAEDFASAPVLAILEHEAVRRRFGLGLDDLPVIQRWISVPGVRQALAGEDTLEPDWQRRLQSLLLGYVMGEGAPLPVGGVLPDPVVSEAEAAMLGRLQSFVESLDWLRGQLVAEALPVGHWRERLEAVLERFFEPAIQDQSALAVLERALLTCAREARAAGVAEPLPLAAFLEHLRGRLLDAPPVPSGVGVSFCGAAAMLGTPHAVVCVLGASHPLLAASFPGSVDLLAEERRRLAPRREYWYFLQALLSARRVFYVSYVGRSVHDNRALPAPGPVRILLAQVAADYRLEGEGEPLAQVRFEHPLSNLSQRYFLRNDPLFSYSEELCAVSRMGGHGSAEPGSLVVAPLTAPGPAWNAVELARLGLFFRHPTRFLLRERLGLDLDEQLPGPALDPTVQPAPPLAAALLEIQLQAGGEPVDLHTALQTAGLLPPGRLGEVALRLTEEGMVVFARRLREAQTEAVLNPLELETTVDGIRLMGRLRGVSPEGLLVFGAMPPGAGDCLDLWLKHLALNLLAPPGVTPVSTWLDPSGGFSLQPVAEPLPILESLLALYREGLCQPLHLFPRSALGFARILRGEGERLPEEVAREIWLGSGEVTGEADDPYIRLAFRGEDPLDEAFVMLANRVFGPLLERWRGLRE